MILNSLLIIQGPLALTIPAPDGGTVNIGGVGGMPTGGVDTLSNILSVGIGLLFIISVLLCLTFIIWGGFDWMTAGGNKENIQKARHKLIWAIVGIFVVFLAFFIINVISDFFGVKFYELPWLRNPLDCPPGAGGCR